MATIRILFVDITNTHGSANLDLTATINSMPLDRTHCSILPLKAALFRELLDNPETGFINITQNDWRNIWVVNEGINLRLPIPIIDGINRKLLFRKYTKSTAEELEEDLETLVPDLVHCNSFNMRLAPIYLACQRHRIPVVAHVRNYRPLNNVERRLLKQTKHILTVSEAMRTDFLRRTKISPKRCTAWHNGIPLQQIQSGLKAETIRQELKISPEKKVISFIGRISTYRGVQYFVDAMIPVLEKFPEAIGLVAGQLGYRDLKRSEAIQHRVAREIGNERFIFVLDRKDMANFLAASDITVFPHIFTDPAQGMIEGISGNLLLAMALGVPVVCTPSGSAAELVLDQETGLIVPPQDAGAIAEAVGRLLTEPELARKLGAAAQKKIEDEHQAAIRSEQLLEIYRSKVLK